jgi:hypothetical protein
LVGWLSMRGLAATADAAAAADDVYLQV